jgi:hypothetical protein
MAIYKNSPPDTLNFVQAAGITDITQIRAISTLVTDLKYAGIWNKFKAIYPMIGGTATSHKFNLKDPRDVNDAYRLFFSGGGTHSANGYQGNGTNAFANTFLNPLTQLTLTSTHLSYYSRTLTVNTQIEIGVWSSGPDTLLQLRPAVNFLSGAVSSTNSFTTTTNARGFWIGTKRSNTDRKAFRNGISESTVTLSDSANFPNYQIYIGARNYMGTAEFYSTKECAFASIGDGLTDTEASAFYTAVQKYQTTLGRQV